MRSTVWPFAVEQLDFSLDQIGLVRRPEQRTPQPDRLVAHVEQQVAPELAPGRQTAGVVHQRALGPVAREPDAYAPVVGHGAIEAQRQRHAQPVDVRRPAQFGDAHPRQRLEPHGLPDAGGAVVPDVAGLLFPVLLAARLLQVSRIVFGADDDDLPVSLDEKRRDLGREGGMPPLMFTGEPPVDPDARPCSRRRRNEGPGDPCAGRRRRGIRVGTRRPDEIRARARPKAGSRADRARRSGGRTASSRSNQRSDRPLSSSSNAKPQAPQRSIQRSRRNCGRG